MKSKLSTTEAISEKCEILEKIIISISDIYENATETQKSFIETTIGASIFYISQNASLWTGKISENAFKNLKSKKKITKDHQYPRKIAGKELFENKQLLQNNKISVKQLFEEKYGRFNYITPEENGKLRPFQKEENFISVEHSYREAKILLKEISNIEFKKYKNK